MEALLGVVNSQNPASASDVTDLVGSWFLLGLSLFVELLVSLVSLMLIYNVGRSIIVTRGFTRPTDPINIYKWMILCLSLTLFMRAGLDAVVLLIWDEISLRALTQLIATDRIMNALAMIPFGIFGYLLLRAGPTLEFQLLRKPIPTDMKTTWVKLKKPLLSILTVMVLSAVITIAK